MPSEIRNNTAKQPPRPSMNIASRIPNEILGEIFLHAIDGPISNIQDSNSFPWALDRVCKSWRYAFVTYPNLWTCITINLAGSHSRGQDFNAVNQYLSLCLERSRNYPLNISLHLTTGECDENSPFFTLLWQTFLSCSHRWRNVYLGNVHGRQIYFLSSRPCATPILESLTIHSLTDDIGYVDFPGFQIAPRLNRFTLLHPIAMLAIQKWSIPWMQLTNLMLRFEEIIGVDQLCILLKQLRNIEELHLILGGDEPRIDLSDFVHNSRTPQCLQHLRVLEICCVEILGLITAPSLSELYLKRSELFYPPTGDGDPYAVVAEEIVNRFIRRSSCKIQKLTLSDFLHYLFTPLVQLFPHVVELCLTDALKCLGHLLSPYHFPALRVLDCTTRTTDAEYFMGTLLAILQLRNSFLARCSAAALAKVISRPILEDGEASALITTTDWASFKSYVQVGSYCELDLTKLSDILFPDLILPLGDFDSNIFRNDGDINFERDFGQWFTEDDLFLL